MTDIIEDPSVVRLVRFPVAPRSERTDREAVSHRCFARIGPRRRTEKRPRSSQALQTEVVRRSPCRRDSVLGVFLRDSEAGCRRVPGRRRGVPPFFFGPSRPLSPPHISPRVVRREISPAGELSHRGRARRGRSRALRKGPSRVLGLPCIGSEERTVGVRAAQVSERSRSSRVCPPRRSSGSPCCAPQTTEPTACTAERARSFASIRGSTGIPVPSTNASYQLG